MVCDSVMREEDFLFNRRGALAYLHSNESICKILQTQMCKRARFIVLYTHRPRISLVFADIMYIFLSYWWMFCSLSYHGAVHSYLFILIMT